MRVSPIILLLVLVFNACTPSQTDTPKVLPSLSAIDSLMWEQLDSALKVMMEFTESGRADSLDEFDGHYCQLLISELLYKNHYAQTNREDLLKAVEFFDSIDDGFLAARAHYMNGVGYVEKDSVVEACTEYLKTLKIMETHLRPNHFHRFMALTYSRIGELLSRQYLQEPSIACFNFRLKEIANILDLRENTVAKYRSSIKKKTGIESVENLMCQII